MCSKLIQLHIEDQIYINVHRICDFNDFFFMLVNWANLVMSLTKIVEIAQVNESCLITLSLGQLGGWRVRLSPLHVAFLKCYIAVNADGIAKIGVEYRIDPISRYKKKRIRILKIKNTGFK